MEPIGYGFLIVVGSAAIAGVLIGAIGGAIAWRFRVHVLLGLALTACAFVALLFADEGGRVTWLSAQLLWGLPTLTMSFLVCAISARGLAMYTALRPRWIALAAFGLALATGLVYLSRFGLDLGSVPRTTSVADVVLIAILLFISQRHRRIDPHGTSRR